MDVLVNSVVSKNKIFFDGTSCSGKTTLVNTIACRYSNIRVLNVDFVDLLKIELDQMKSNLKYNMDVLSIIYMGRWIETVINETTDDSDILYLIDRYALLSNRVYKNDTCFDYSSLTHDDLNLIVFYNEKTTFVEETRNRGYFDATITDLELYRHTQNNLFRKSVSQMKENSKIIEIDVKDRVSVDYIIECIHKMGFDMHN